MPRHNRARRRGQVQQHHKGLKRPRSWHRSTNSGPRFYRALMRLPDVGLYGPIDHEEKRAA